jgi:hypothetical protein
LKKIIILIFLIAVGYHFIKDNSSHTSVPSYTSEDLIESDFSEEQNFTCDGRQHCSQMNSYEEAVFFINNCPDTKMDGDNDGIPCERQFGR